MPDAAIAAAPPRSVSPARAMAPDHVVLRGVLILAVMLDHNDIVRNVRAVNAWFLPMTWHVAGFLLLPFLVPPRRLSWPMLRDHAVRYLVPFVWAVLGYACAYQLLILRRAPDLAAAGRLGRALLLADPESLQHATGFIVLWFMPALLSVVLLAAAWSTAPRLRPFLLALALAVHLCVGAVAPELRGLVPFGMLIALAILPLGLLVRANLPVLARCRGNPWVVLGGFVVLLAAWGFERGHEVEVATLVLPTLARPLWVLATDAQDLAMLAILVAAAPFLARIPFLPVLGRYSLLVYLVHPLLYKPILAVGLRVAAGGLYWPVAACSVAAVGAASVACAMSVERVGMARKLFTPRNLAELIFTLKNRDPVSAAGSIAPRP